MGCPPSHPSPTPSVIVSPALLPPLSHPQVKYNLCDEKHPYISAESASALELDSFLDAKTAVAGKQVADWHAGIRPPTKTQRVTGRQPPNAFPPAKRGPRRSLQFKCSGFESFLNVSPTRHYTAAHALRLMQISSRLPVSVVARRPIMTRCMPKNTAPLHATLLQVLLGKLGAEQH